MLKNSNRFLIAASVSVFTIASFALSAKAAPANFCNVYAAGAVAQQAENVRRGCGFGGPRWHSWFAGHKAWCLGKSKGRAHAEGAYRLARLLSRPCNRR